MFRAIFLILLVFLFWSCTSCNSDNPPNENDINDQDRFVEQDLDFVTDTDSMDSDFEKDDETDDEQTDLDNDANSGEDCPSLRAADFPYYREDGSTHFCRKCDLPASSDDPDCVRNLWSEANKKYFEKFPEKDCSGYPCVIKDLRATVKSDDIGYGYFHECDRLVNPTLDVDNIWPAGREDWRHHFIDKGKVTFDMYTSLSSTAQASSFPTDSRLFNYDPEKDEYTAIMPVTNYTLANFNGKSVSQTMNYNKITGDDSYSIAYKTQFLVMYEEGKGYDVIYPGTVRFIPYSSITMSDDWIFMVFQEEEGKQYQMKYAKVGEWDKWYEMERETVNVPNLSGNHLAFYNDDGEAFICDLSKLPKKVSDCKKINREDEYIYNPSMNKTDSTRFAYSQLNAANQEITMTVVKIEGDDFKYTDYPPLPCQSSKTVVGYGVDQFKDDTIIHSEVFQIDQDTRSSQLCYFDLATQKNTCQGWADQGIADFDGKYLLYHTFKATGLILRDMECYCKDKPEACPFDEYRDIH